MGYVRCNAWFLQLRNILQLREHSVVVTVMEEISFPSYANVAQIFPTCFELSLQLIYISMECRSVAMQWSISSRTSIIGQPKGKAKADLKLKPTRRCNK